MRSLRRLVVPVVVAFMAVVGIAAPASAHDRLVSSDPADGATLTAVPAAFTFTFVEDPLATGAQVVITPQGGEPIRQDATVSGTKVSVPAPPALANGSYEVAWRVVSDDGHPVEGTIHVTLAVPQAASPSPTPTADPATPSPTASPTVAPATTGDSSGMWTGVGALVVAALAVIGLLVLRRRGLDPNGPRGQH
ncbi:MAG: copper resistance protein CopC [Promicromonosporaceae bacterium]|nr:copper resistance protein CopC [Promicromonosporaceae bacterium]